VLAGGGLLGRPVRWVHAIEVADAARLLHGGELVLTTGIALPDEPSLQARYVGELAAVGVAGLAVSSAAGTPDGCPRRWSRPRPSTISR
jgi:purine catabolism regulator